MKHPTDADSGIYSNDSFNRCLRASALAAALLVSGPAAWAGDSGATGQPVENGESGATQAAALLGAANLDQAKRSGIAAVPPAVAEGLTAKAISNQQKLDFIKIVAPLILHVNERILRDRLRIEILQIYSAAGLELDAKDADWLLQIARRYRLKEIDFDALLRRVDIIPPSLALAQAAEESGWGRSRFAREGFALFGQRVYAGNNGMVPRERADGEVYRVRAFKTPLQAVRAYKHNLNTHSAYARFREQRAEMRRHRAMLDGYRLADGLLYYSERREAYLDTIRTIMRTNGLGALDRLQAAEPWPGDSWPGDPDA